MHLFKREQNSELSNIRASFIHIVILLVAVLQFLKYTIQATINHSTPPTNYKVFFVYFNHNHTFIMGKHFSFGFKTENIIFLVLLFFGFC